MVVKTVPFNVMHSQEVPLLMKLVEASRFHLGRQHQHSAVICSGTLLFSSRVLRPNLVTLCSHKSGRCADELSSLVPSVLHLSHGFQCSPTLNRQLRPSQTSAKAPNVNQKWSGLWIRISRLIRMYVRLLLKMLWINYLVNISHFAKCHKNQPVTARIMLINLLKSPIP